ncbi:response regulator transcription factor [Arthrobacter sp. MDT3-44]
MLPALNPVLPLVDSRRRTAEHSGRPNPQSGTDAEPVDIPRILTDRQESIAAMIAHGLTCQDIAEALHVPLRTIEGHADRVLETLGLRRLEDLTDDAIGRYRRSAAGVHYGELAHPHLVADPPDQPTSPACPASQDPPSPLAQHSANEDPHNTSGLGPDQAAPPVTKQAFAHTPLDAPLRTSGRTLGRTSETARFGR